MDDPMWLSEPFTRAQAWVDLLSLANHKDGYIIVAGDRIDIKRGQCGWSMLNLSKRWRWSRGKTKRFVNQLEIDEKIVQQTNTRNSIITICNYNKYQGDDTTDEPKVGHQTVQQTDIRRDTNKNDNNVKKEKEKKLLSKPSAEDIKNWKVRTPEKWEKGKYLESGFKFTNNLVPEDFPENYDPKEDCTNSLYNPQWFDGKVIILRKNDYDNWLKTTGWSQDYFDKVLSERDDWLASEPAKAKNWFMSTSKFLQNSAKQN